MENHKLSSAHIDFGRMRPEGIRMVTAQDVFLSNPEQFVGGKFNANFFTDNHVLLAAERAEANVMRNIDPFLKDIATFPHIQIRTIRRNLFGPESKVQLPLEWIMRYHKTDVELANALNPELTAQLGTEARDKSLRVLDEMGMSIKILQEINELSLPVPGEVLQDRSLLYPLFNIATLARLCKLTDSAIPETLLARP